MDLIQRSFLKSYELHKDQSRKMSDTPYFVHLLSAVNYLMYETRKEEIISACFLHDTLEDTSYTGEELRREFGEEVFRLVNFCTEPGNNFDNSVEDQRKSWKERKLRSISKLENGSEDELLVFCADKVSNLSSMHDDLLKGVNIWDKFNGSREEVHWYYSEIEKALEKKLGDRRIFKVYKNLMKIF